MVFHRTVSDGFLPGRTVNSELISDQIVTDPVVSNDLDRLISMSSAAALAVRQTKCEILSWLCVILNCVMWLLRPLALRRPAWRAYRGRATCSGGGQNLPVTIC